MHAGLLLLMVIEIGALFLDVHVLQCFIMHTCLFGLSLSLSIYLGYALSILNSDSRCRCIV